MEAEYSTSHTQVIDNSDTAEFLLNTESRRLIQPFWGKAKTAAVAAKELGMSTSSLLYQINKLLDLGILKIVAEKKRAGRASKVYQTTTESYFVPFKVTKAETLEAYLQGVKSYYEKLLTSSIAEVMQAADKDWGMRLYRDEDGKLQMLTATYPDKVIRLDEAGPAILDFYYPDLQLDFEDAKALQQELGQVFQKYSQKRGSQKYLWHVGLTPVLKDKGS